MVSSSTWVCRRSEGFRYGLLQRAAPCYFISGEAGKKQWCGRKALQKQAVKVFCIRQRLVGAQEVRRAGGAGEFSALCVLVWDRAVFGLVKMGELSAKRRQFLVPVEILAGGFRGLRNAK